MASGANFAGTKMIEAFGCVSLTASATVLNTGTPATSLPEPPGVTPETTLVPYSTICVVWKEPSRPVMPWTSRRVFLPTRMLTWKCSFAALCADSRLDHARGRLVHAGHRSQPRFSENGPSFFGVRAGKPD